MAKKASKIKKSRNKAIQLRQVLDVLNVDAIRRGRAFGEKVARLYWELYCELAYQRSQVKNQINEWAASTATGPFEFSSWRRVVRYQFANDPLSVEGSIKSIGGRFNIGDIDSAKFPTFAALYAASDQKTALAEAFGQPKTIRSDLTALDMALATDEPYACVTLKGRLDEVIDLRQEGILEGISEINKSFVISKHLSADFKAAGWPQDIILNANTMLKSVLEEAWRIYPMQFDVPANSQIFGQMIAGYGIQGILYPSTKHGGECLAIFPQNFGGTDSFVELEGQMPKSLVRSRLDGSIRI